MNGLALITDMEYIKVGNKGFAHKGSVPLCFGEAAKSALFHGAGWKLKTLIKKIPECDYITKNILQQGTDLKMSLMEYTFDEAIEKN